jgi:putative CocE/NonD family hydrolase
MRFATRSRLRPGFSPVLASLFFLCLVAQLPLAQTPPTSPATTNEDFYKYQKVMVPMRDGIKLETVIMTPRNQQGPLPILIERTPYGVPQSDAFVGYHPDPKSMEADGYISVFQNIRGRFESEGEFEMNRPPRSLMGSQPEKKPDSKTIDEVTDAWDTIDWLVKNVPNNNGRVGIYGTSYPGWLVMEASLNPHPALKAAIEMASPEDMFLNDDFHHNGTFRLSYGFEYSALLESSKTENTNFKFDRGDTYDWYLRLGPLSNGDANYFHGKMPTWENFVAHPNRDAFWQERALTTYLTEPKLPIIHVSGWWDQEDMVGPQTIYTMLEKRDPHHLNYFVAGPWRHGQWNGAGLALGPIQFGSDTSLYYQQQIEKKWFAYWLKDENYSNAKAAADFPEAQVFQTGSNRWQSYDSWPPKSVTPKRIYLQPAGKLSFDPPTTDPPSKGAAYDEYVSDPANPVPYRPRPVTPTYPGPEWPVWLVQDQHFVDHREDVLTFSTEPLTENVTITGDVVAELFASTSGSDSDWIVKLIDVCPADASYNAVARQPMAEFELMLNADIVRARFRENMAEPKAVPPQQPLKYTIDLHANDHVFRPKHRIMVQVQSTWFPVYDRNPQNFVPNIFTARAEDYQKATQRIYHSPAQPSALVLPVNTGSSVPDDAPDSCYLPLKLSHKIDAATLDSYIGTYQAPGFTQFTIVRDGDQLYATVGSQKFPLRPVSDTDFFISELNLEMNFAPDADGKVRGVAVRNGSNPPHVSYRVEK